ncbi:hypothetical protein [Allomesorhizobium alhagi]|uniref:Lytic transglycosylase catalytic subunit n=1 Tax=Mesorhizobium alhagi CCNWXJ12-2 TaxID=1107882 RepID=H0HXJ0_9HYPH|nr:lytic transglycosylase catalytic subunit [Mesorhizobium alhagi CCNWXJ12-2]
MHGRFGYPGLFAAYNAGPTRYEKNLRTGRPLPAETRAYMHKRTGTRAETSTPAEKSLGTGLLFPLRSNRNIGPANEKARPGGAVFVPLRIGRAGQ